MTQNTYKLVPGQRWASEMEPELGLGILEDISGRAISIFFRAGDCLRRYSRKSAPVKRVIFNRGDVVKSKDNTRLTVQSMEEQSGIIIYHGNGISLSETELADTISFSGPKERLYAGYSDSSPDAFNLRYKTLEIRCRHRQSKSYGFAGGRVDLIKHQFYIAEEVSSRHMPRVLLSDETGLGKTIEAGLILHRLLLSERISRVLILVPESLVHQWFVEFYRRFNLIFSIFDSDFCHGHEQDLKYVNPFLESQTGICSINWLASSSKRRDQVIDAGWDMLVIDEAHHIEDKKEIYSFVQKLSQNVKSMMLLSATPEKPGLKGYFACLKLLDPLRFYDFDLFLRQAESYKTTADRIDRILKGRKNKDSGVDKNGNLDLTMEDFLDRYGPGRVIFRNTRSKVKGFPGRVEHICLLDGKEKEVNDVNSEFLWEIVNTHEIHSDFALRVLKEKGLKVAEWPENIDCKEYGKSLKAAEESAKGKVRSTSWPLFDFTDDIRITWLVDFLKQDKDRKVLLICKTKEKAAAIDLALQRKINVKKALFHEDLSLIQRDRNAAWFSEENGARILICSEIGSEGRNFQFAQHLVMFDLPFNPELIEQRIGRLDRIGQRKKIHIHILCIKDSAGEIILRWYNSGINIFRENTGGAHFIFQKFKKELVSLAVKKAEGEVISLKELNELIQNTVEYKNYLTGELKKGRDKLIEFNSFRPGKAESLIRAVKQADRNPDTENFILKLFRHFNIEWENIENRVFRLSFDHAGESGYPIPALKKDGMVVTFDRAKAVTRGDLDFLTLDHPMVTAGMELLLGMEQGNSCFAKISGIGRPDILLESIFVLECIAPKKLYIDRFLPATPIRTVVGHKLSDFADTIDCTGKYPFDFFENRLQIDNKSWIHSYPEILETIIPFLFKKSSEISELKADKIIKKAEKKARFAMGKEVERLEYLKKINFTIREEEIDAARRETDLVSEFVLNAGLRLDAVRLIRQE